MTRKLEINITIDDTFSQISNQLDVPGLHLRTALGCTYTAEQTVAINLIVETAKCLLNNIPLDRHFNPLAKTDNKYVIVKCEWLKSGNLVLRDAAAKKRFAHAESLEDAIQRKGVFTTMMDIYNNLPKRRGNKGSQS